MRSASSIIAVAMATGAIVAALVVALVVRQAIAPSLAEPTATVAELVHGADTLTQPTWITGRIASGARRASLRFRLRGSSGAVIDVIPRLGVAVPRAEHGRRLRVRGSVVRIAGARVLAASNVQRIPAPPLFPSVVAPRMSLRSVWRDSRDVDGRSATLVGRVSRVAAHGFVLSAGPRSLFVSTNSVVGPSMPSRRAVDRGRRVTATGELQRLSVLAARELAIAHVGARVPAQIGDPYLIARALQG